MAVVSRGAVELGTVVEFTSARNREVAHTGKPCSTDKRFASRVITCKRLSINNPLLFHPCQAPPPLGGVWYDVVAVHIQRPAAASLGALEDSTVYPRVPNGAATATLSGN